MRLVPGHFSTVPAGLVLATMVSTAEAQVPAISARQYTGGSVTLVVTGSIQINDSVAINTAASFSDGEMTWLQYGASGSPTPNLLITFTDRGYGVGLGMGKKVATAEPEHCTGTTQVTATSITGNYDCKGVTSYDGGTGNMGRVDIKVRFTAKT
jgi:hypothetical protein